MNRPDDQQALRAWANEQMKAMAKHLASHGLIEKDQISVEGRWSYPFRILLAQAWGAQRPHERFWVVAGDVPTDHLDGSMAADPRAALRHFALRWQAQAARLKSGDKDLAPGEARSKDRMNWTELGESLALRAEFVYSLAEDDRNWQATHSV
jgi:hypothetical protein